MEKSKVHFINLRTTPGTSLLDKLGKLVKSAGIETIDFKNKFTAVKTHFGEYGNLSYVRHNYIKKIVDILIEQKAHPFVTDCNTLYVGRRKNALEHLQLAYENGFNPLTLGCNVLIGDGLLGTCQREIEINKKHVKFAKIGSTVADADLLISITHFKGHELTGFGGTLKNIGMGCGSIPGKLEMHSNANPFYKDSCCVGCGICIKNCAHDALSLTPNRKVAIDSSKCVGCGQCVAMCQFNAMRVSWNETSANVGEKIAEYAYAVLLNKPAFHISFIMNVSPNCDCWTSNDTPIIADIGIAASFDPVALDRACVDMVNKAPIANNSLLQDKVNEGSKEKDKFKCLHNNTNWEATLKHAEELGLGSNEYEIVNLDS